MSAKADKSADAGARFTPMFQQWERARQEAPDALILFRMGDFYEVFGEQAEVVSRALDLTLTARECGQSRKIPMCGVPYHSIDRYLERLVQQGFKAAICEQVSDPKTSKGLVDREITRVVTKGTLIEDGLLDARRNNFLAALFRDPSNTDRYGIAWVDVSTGQFCCCETDTGPRGAFEELARIAPAECLVTQGIGVEDGLVTELSQRLDCRIETVDDQAGRQRASETLMRHFGIASLSGFGLERSPAAVEAAAMVLSYIGESRLDLARHVRGIALKVPGESMYLDAATQRNLELTRSIRDGGVAGTLQGVLDHTLTPMGARLLRAWVLAPLRDVPAIRRRHEAVEWLVASSLIRRDLRDALARVQDLERLTARVSAGSANARDLVALRLSLESIPGIGESLASADGALLTDLREALDPVAEAAERVAQAILDEPPVTVRDGGLIRAGYNAELDELREASSSGKEWIARLEAEERERTGIKSLRVGYNSVFGYYIEVSNANKDAVPEDFIRKQTLANAERYITPALKEWEAKVLGADDRIMALEYDLLCEVRTYCGSLTGRVLDAAAVIAELDTLACLAEVAVRRNYVRPIVDSSDEVEVEGGRHPVVESMMPEGQFVPNDAHLSSLRNQVAIVTGPNMAGKSTYLRQTALIVLMAQMGGFVPAVSARIGIVDRIFTRVGAHDDLAQGQSTFMVEMTETANILHNATRDSLIILDEIGRGTSTFDGLSIAWSVVEYIHNVLGAKTLFATHYHQLNALCESLDRVRNYRILVKEEGETMVFLRRIVEGGTDRSYGIQVARLAGVPGAVLERAREVLLSLEESNHVGTLPSRTVAPPELSFSMSQLSLFSPAKPDPRIELLRAVERIDPNGLTPLAALNFLDELRRKLIEIEKKSG